MSSAGSILLVAALIGYLLGSIPFGLLVSRVAGAPDPRRSGSRNIGATNVLRTGGRSLAAATLLFDALKGAAAVWLLEAIHPELLAPSLPAMIAGLFAFVGHVYPVWLRFQGGKGVATMLGVAASLSWQCGLAFAGVWLLGVALTRHSSVGGMTAAAATPVAAAVIDESGLTLLFLAMTIVVLWKHRGNVERLLDGTEPRVGAGS
jgi:glycerol-3-phosphate acyltransferase PlsY